MNRLAIGLVTAFLISCASTAQEAPAAKVAAKLAGSDTGPVSVERGRYNDVVQRYNTAIKSFPTMTYAGAFGFKEKPYFTATTGAEVAPKVDFGTQGTSAK